MKKYIAGLLSAALIATAGTGAMAQDMIDVVVGFPPAVDFLPVVVGAEKGFCKAHGLNVTPTIIPIATNITAGVLSNSLQIGMTTPTIILPAVENGLDLVAVSAADRLMKGNENISLVTVKGKPVKVAKDVEGMKIGVPGILSTGDLIFRKYLKNEGVDLSKVTFIETPFPRMFEMMKSNTVDGVLAAEPIRGGLIGTGLGERAGFEYYSAVLDGAVLTMWMASGKWLEANPTAAEAFRACHDEAAAWIVANREDAAVIEEKIFSRRSNFTPDWSSAISAEDFKPYNEIGKEFDLVRTDVDLNKIVGM